MKELGDNAHQAHQELGETIAELGGLDALYTVGGLAAQIPGAAAYFPSSAEAAVVRRPVPWRAAGRCDLGERLAGDGDGARCGGADGAPPILAGGEDMTLNPDNGCCPTC